MSIIFIAGKMDTCAPFIVLKMHAQLWSRDMNLLADVVQTMQRELCYLCESRLSLRELCGNNFGILRLLSILELFQNN